MRLIGMHMTVISNCFLKCFTTVCAVFGALFRKRNKYALFYENNREFQKETHLYC